MANLATTLKKKPDQDAVGARRRLPEPFYYVPTNPIVYSNTTNGRAAIVRFDPIPQNTVNVVFGAYAMGATPGLVWRNLMTSCRVAGREAITGPGALLGLIAGEVRITGPRTGSGDQPGIPTMNGAAFWPGQTLQLYPNGQMVGGFPLAGEEQLQLRLVNLTGDPDDDITQIGFYCAELPVSDAMALNKDELQQLWDLLIDGINALSFMTHQIDYDAALANFEDPCVVNTWHDQQQRRTGFRNAVLVTDEGPPVTVNLLEESLRLITVNTKTDRTLETGTNPVPASVFGGFAGLDMAGMCPVDMKSNGNDRDTVIISAPAPSVGLVNSYFAVTTVSGILQRQYFGRVAGQPM